MASFQSSPSATGSDDASKIEVLAEAMYDAVRDEGERLWTQASLEGLDIIPENNIIVLQRVIQKLCNAWLFRPLRDGSLGLCWKWRSEEDAKKYRELTSAEHRLIYECIDDAGADGIWRGKLSQKINLHQNVLNAGLKYLETKGYIKDMKSVEKPAHKMYIKASLKPSERATGGPWFTDSSLDEAFIEHLLDWIFEFVKRESSFLHKAGDGPGGKQPKKGVVRGAEPARGKKRGADAMAADDQGAGAGVPHAARAKKRGRDGYLPYPAGYTAYPTAEIIAKVIAQRNVTNNTVLKESEVQMLLDVLVYENVVEPVAPLPGSDVGYRVANAARLDVHPRSRQGEDDVKVQLGAPLVENGFTEVPCGRCPVFDLCDVGGPVSPDNCVYFTRWLGLEVEDLGARVPAGTK